MMMMMMIIIIIIIIIIIQDKTFKFKKIKKLGYQRKGGCANAHEDGRTMKWLTQCCC
jgi:Ca2+-dependent lipid-binding protein